MKRIYLTLFVVLLISMQAFPQTGSAGYCQADFKWEVNDKIMMFAPGWPSTSTTGQKGKS